MAEIKTDDELLYIEGLKIEIERKRGSLTLLEGVDLSIKKKRSFGIVGESGCGKSITVNALLGLLPYPLRVSGGRALFKTGDSERELLGLPPEELREIRGREIAMIFQEPMNALDPVFNVEFQMGEALEFHRPGMGKKEKSELCLEMLRKVNIPRPEQALKSYPHELSGGQLQRVMIAIALINSPRLLIADEPTTALDVTIQAQILDLMNSLKAERDTSIIMITHDLGVIAETCEEVAVFYAGQVVEEAGAADLFHSTAHPYTRGLLRAVTSLSGGKRELYTIPGMVPSGGEWKGGCRFADRCEKKTEPCTRAMPALMEIGGPGRSHRCRCFLWGDKTDPGSGEKLLREKGELHG
ncbi:MAG: ABC transporter ATP-binding protein [Treponema sp.]|jgi:peptide/nickel transport system ATP-binding protein|nr:ABC transporter ATP-binding protein [Treponema sp.]